MSLVILPVLLGCSTHMTKKYNYNDVTREYSWGRLEAKLTGTMSTVDGNDIVGSPYELLLWFYPSSSKCYQITIRSIQIIDQAGNIAYVKNGENKKGYTNNKSSSIFFMYDNIVLEYKNYNLILNCEIKDNKNVINHSHKIHLKFIKNYQGSRSFLLWDRLMSV